MHHLSSAMVFCLLSFATSSMATTQCQFFKLSPTDNSLRPCSQEISKIDTDADGVPDWQTNSLFGETYYPLDTDLDGDHIPNFLDPDPFKPNHGEVKNQQFPSHLLSPTAEAQKIQTKLFRQTGILVSAQGSPLNSKFLSILERLLKRAFSTSELAQIHKLKNIIVVPNLQPNDALGLYIEPIDTILVAQNLLDRPEPMILETLAHEIGHALLFSRLTPASFVSFAKSTAGWTLSQSDSFYAPANLKRFSGVIKHRSAFPTTYSLANSHEWFAENFSRYLLGRLGYSRPITREIAANFDHLLSLHY